MCGGRNPPNKIQSPGPNRRFLIGTGGFFFPDSQCSNPQTNTKSMSKKNTFRSITPSSSGFKPLESLSEYWGYTKEGKPCRLGVLHKTYRNETGFNPGKPIWVYALDGKGGWAATSEISEEDLRNQVIAIRHS